MTIQSYKDALFQIKRGFLIIGLTGFTGSGCSTIRNLILAEGKPALPSFDSIPRFHVQSEKSRAQKDEHVFCLSIRIKRIYDKLKSAWEDTGWVGFVHVKISLTIFSFAVHRALFSKKKNEILEQIRQIAIKHKAELKKLRYLKDPKTKLKEDTSFKFLKAYELCQDIYNDFSLLYDNNKGDLIKIMQDFGDEIRKHGIVSPNKSQNAAPKNIFVLPEAIRRVIKAHG